MKKSLFALSLIIICYGCQNKVKVSPNEDSYTSFGAIFSKDSALSNKEMVTKYLQLKHGDTLDVTFKSKINSVCQKKGCWMNVALTNDREVFVKFKDYAFFVPLNADNNQAIVNGKAFVDVVSVDELKHYAKDGGKSVAEIAKITKPETTYSFLADGVYIKK